MSRVITYVRLGTRFVPRFVRPVPVSRFYSQFLKAVQGRNLLKRLYSFSSGPGDRNEDAGNRLDIKYYEQQNFPKDFHTFSREDLLVYVGKLKSDLKKESVYHYILGIRCRIENLERMILPPGYEKHEKSRYKRWVYILTKFEDSTGLVSIINSKLTEKGLSVEAFAKALQVVYGDWSDTVVHKVTLPKMRDEDIIAVLELLEIPDDDIVKKSLSIIINSLKKKSE